MCSRPRLQSHIFDENIYFTSDIMQIGPNVCITYRERTYRYRFSVYLLYYSNISPKYYLFLQKVIVLTYPKLLVLTCLLKTDMSQ